MGEVMTNKVWNMLSGLKSILETELDTDVKYYGYFPDNVQMIGNKFPAILISDGDESRGMITGTQIEQMVSVAIYLYTNDVVDRIENALQLERKITDACLKDLTIGGTAILIEPAEIDKGGYSANPDKYSVGYYPNLTVRKLNFNVLIYDTRSV